MADQVRPPYVRFERRAVEDRAQTISSGKYAFKNVDMAIITVPGSKDSPERVAKDWLADLERRVQDGLAPGEWLSYFARLYETWQKGEELPLNGTPIKGWGGLNPAQQKAVIQADLYTVEDLAVANEQALQAIGMGSRGFKDKAVAWVKEAEGPGKLAAENVALRTQVTDLTQRVEDLAARLEAAPAKIF
jgi:hypothetical protein